MIITRVSEWGSPLIGTFIPRYFGLTGWITKTLPILWNYCECIWCRNRLSTSLVISSNVIIWIWTKLRDGKGSFEVRMEIVAHSLWCFAYCVLNPLNSASQSLLFSYRSSMEVSPALQSMSSFVWCVRSKFFSIDSKFSTRGVGFITVHLQTIRELQNVKYIQVKVQML